jgi:hypothetical protein
MKLAEGLALRADLQKRLLSLQERAQANALHQEGEKPPEDAPVLVADAERALAELERLIARINATNSAAQIPALGLTATEALARRDVLRLRHALYTKVADAATGRSGVRRQMRSELTFVAAIDVQELRAKADRTAQELRALDALIQQSNWSIELSE